MPIVAEEYQFVMGVDTHAASHSFAVIALHDDFASAPIDVIKPELGDLPGSQAEAHQQGQNCEVATANR